VAVRTARRARADASRLQVALPEQIEAAAPPRDDAYQFDLRPLLLEELDRLPSKYREPIVLCHLEGKTHEEAAQLLRWPVGTVSGRLSRGRQLLKSRLERRGLAVSSAVLTTPALAGITAAMTPPLEESAVTAATRFVAALPVSSSVLSLAQGVSRTMLLHKLKTVAVAVFLVGTAVGSVGVWAHWPSHAAVINPRVGEPAVNPATTPVPNVSPALQPSESSSTLVAGNRSADCPVFGGDNRPAYCPLTIAANTVSRVFSYFHDGSAASK
jgi:hypothetical protein